VTVSGRSPQHRNNSREETGPPQINHPRRPASTERPIPCGPSPLRSPQLPDDRPHPEPPPPYVIRSHPDRSS
jgi:hypothetical protein